MTTAISGLPRRAARMGRYTLWQLRDYAMNQGPSTALVLALAGYLFIAPALAAGEGRYTLHTLPLGATRRIFLQLSGYLVFLGALFATNGIVANDRKFGFFRFYFAKPVSPPRFYANAFAANGLGFLAVSLLLWGVFSAIVRPVGDARWPLVIAGMYVAYAGIGFLVSVISRFDWLSLLSVVFAAQIGWTFWGRDGGIRGALVHLLPPLHRGDELYAAVALAQPIPWPLFAWLAGYGAACFVLGLVVLRRRPLASGT